MTIYFNAIGEAYADPIEDAVATVDNATWSHYCEYEKGTKWDLKDGKFVALDTAENLDAVRKAQRRIRDLKTMLSDTDYIVSKLAEASVLGQDVETLKAKYSQELEDRKSWREEINELEEKYQL